jgi:hypothetical protein
LILDRADAVAELKLALFQPLNLDAVVTGGAKQRADRRVEVAVLLLQPLEFKIEFALFFPRHCFAAFARREAPRRNKYRAAKEPRQALEIAAFFLFLHQGSGLLRRFARVSIDFRFRWWQHSPSRTANRERTHPMSIESHLSELARKHEALEREIEAERTHPGSDSLKLAELKRRKLSLKDEIEKLREETVH